jgi:acetyl-CoA C-acetyltransferase
VLELADLTPAELDHVDVYSCFPFAVQAGALALGLGLDPLPSVTGGMTFFGGPLGSYVMHSKVSLFERLRAEPGSVGVVGSLGGHYAHFGYGIYSTEQGREGPVAIESYTVAVGHDGPSKITFATLTDDGVRVFARSYDRDLMRSILADEDICGRRGKIAGGILEVA